MRKRIPYRVCSCMPSGCVKHLEARLLRQLVNNAVHPLRCAASGRRKRQVAMRMGDLCAEAGHFQWALKVWRLGLHLICTQDYREWVDVNFNPQRVSLSDVVAEADALILARRIDNLWRALGHPAMARAARRTERAYDWLWYEKYDYDRRQLVRHLHAVHALDRARRSTERLFRDGQTWA